jgi:hypothetical protein
VKTAFILFLASMAMAQSAGTFTVTGKMTSPRFGHTATLLTNGNVLIAGFAATAELYDPATGTFTVTGNMITPRDFGASATLLPDGKVLFAGGSISSASRATTNTASAELYDPSTGIFAATGSMATAKGCPAAVLLSNDTVLVAGGWASWFEPQNPASAELYDPLTGTFSAAGPYAHSSLSLSVDLALCPNAHLLPNGKVLIVWDDDASTAEIYDPDTNTFRIAGTVSFGAVFSPATLLTSGKVLFAGGDLGGYRFGTDTARLYDPSTETSTAVGRMTTRRQDHTATLLSDGTVLIAGGQIGGDGMSVRASAQASAEIYDPATANFSLTGSMINARFGHSATLLLDGTVLIAGGSAYAPGDDPTRAEIYHPAVLVHAPVLLSLPGDNQGAILHAETAQIASAGNPAFAGEALEIYCRGLIDGSPIPPQVSIGGRMAEVLWFGQAPGFENLNQVNVRVPAGLAGGSVVPVWMSYLGRPTNEVTIGIR